MDNGRLSRLFLVKLGGEHGVRVGACLLEVVVVMSTRVYVLMGVGWVWVWSGGDQRYRCCRVSGMDVRV